MLLKGQQIELPIHALSSEGDGVGTYQGLTFFVPFALPGETVLVEVTEVKRSYGKGALKKVLTPSKERITPPCPLFMRCGGCQIMHLSYEGQLAAKRRRVIDALERIGNFKGISVNPCIPSPLPLHYRNKIQLPATSQEGRLALGLYARKSHHVIPVKTCAIHCHAGEEVFSSVNAALQRSSIIPYDEKTGKGELRHLLIKTSFSTNESLVVFVTTKSASKELKMLAQTLLETIPEVKGVFENVNTQRCNVILGNTFTSLGGVDTIKETLLTLSFNVSPASFFQVNPPQAEQLYQKAIALAELSGQETVVDAYCGVGTLALIASSYAKKVIGIECVPSAIHDAKENARQNGIVNSHFICGEVEEHLSFLKEADVLFLNPPRKGCAPSVIDAAAKARPKKIIYISCDPATLARDLSSLRDKGYLPSEVHPFDMFPQTMHVETLVLLIPSKL